MTDALESLRSHLERIEEAIEDGSWETVTAAWTPPATSLADHERAEAALLLARIEDAHEEVARLGAETADIRSEIGLLRRAGKAYVTNDALL